MDYGVHNKFSDGIHRIEIIQLPGCGTCIVSVSGLDVFVAEDAYAFIRQQNKGDAIQHIVPHEAIIAVEEAYLQECAVFVFVRVLGEEQSRCERQFIIAEKAHGPQGEHHVILWNIIGYAFRLLPFLHEESERILGDVFGIDFARLVQPLDSHIIQENPLEGDALQLLSGVADTEVEPSVIIHDRIPFRNVDEDAVLALDVLGTGLGDDMELVAYGIGDGLDGSLHIPGADVFVVVPVTDDHAPAPGVVERGDGLQISVRPRFLPFHIEVLHVHLFLSAGAVRPI